MTTEDLVSATTVHRKDYQDDALCIMDRELTSRNVPAEQKAAIEKEVVQQEQARERRYRGIRGWLVVFILMVAGGSLIDLLSGVAALREAQSFVAVLLILPGVLVALYGFMAFVLLLRKKSSAPSHAARWMIVNFFYGLIVAIIVYALTRSTAGFIILPSAAGLLLWLYYLENSKRVAATYERKTEKSANTPDARDGFSRA
jgi:hypothetical protein